MATRTITTKLAIEGESEYRQSVANINNSLKTLKSELSLVESEFRRSANSTEALTKKGEVLYKMQAEQQKKFDAARAALENARKAQEQYTATVVEYGGKIAAAENHLEELKSSTGDTAEEQAKLNAALKGYREHLDIAEAGQTAAQKGVDDWTRKVNFAERDLNDLNFKIKDNEKYLDEARASTDGHAISIDQYGKKTNQAAKELKNANDTMSAMAAALAAAGITRGLQEIADAIKACVGASVEFESAMAGVFKTVDGTDAQLVAISEGIKQMSTEIPATTTEIAAVAESAGQLGIATADVLDFTRVMIDLGNSTNLSADEAATALARFANITGTSASDYERLGSVIVGLGNNFATTETEITEMATRLASSGTLAGLTESEIMALATAMSSVGIEADAGGTAMTQTLTAMEKAVASGGKDLENFAQIADMSAAEFSTAWKGDAITVIQAFISGLGKLDEQGESATLVLEDLGLSGVRQSNMLKSLALASDTLTGAVGLANQAWVENTALSDEANKRYETTESKLQMMSNAFDNVKVAIGDALTPALREMADVGTDAFSWTAEFLEKNPDVVWGIGAVVAGLGAFTAVLGTTIAYLKVIKPLWVTFSAAVTATPFGAVAIAMGVLLTAFAAYQATIPQVDDHVKELTHSLEESKKAFEDTRDSIQRESEDLLASVSALETLMGVEVKSTAQKQTMAELVDQLNQSVPDLNLAYDAQTDSLTNLSTGAEMTAASIREIALAMAEQQTREADIQRLTELYVEQTRIAIDLAAAQDRLSQAEAEKDRMEEEGIYGAMGYEAETQAVEAAVIAAYKSVRELTDQQNINNTAVDELNGKYEEAEEKIGDTGDAAEESAKQMAKLTPKTEELKAETQDLADEMGMLSSAMEEQRKNGSLNLDTALKLIDAGYATALSINEETGAIKLNKAEYTALAKEKLNEQIVSLQTQQTSLAKAIQLKQEAMAALEAAWSFTALKAAQDELNDMQGQEKSAAAQIAALEKMKKSLGSYTNAASSASKKAQTQAEKDLAKYKELQAELDHQRAMDQISEREYYEKLKEYRDRYLTDEDNLDEYRRITEQIYSYDKSLIDQEAALWEEQTKTLVSELEDRTKSLLDEQSKMEEKLAGYGDLFTIEDGKVSLENVQSQIDAINAYEKALTGLKDQGEGRREISGSLMDEILGMDVDEAAEYANQLLAMSDEQWNAYNDKLDEKQQRAKEVAQQLYQDRLDALGTEYNDKLGNALGELTDTAFTSGRDTAQSLIDGLKEKEPTLYRQAQKMADEIARILSEAYAASGNIDGSHAAGLPYVPFDGYIAQLHQGERVLTAEEAKIYIARSMPRSFEAPKATNAPDIGSMLSQAVNAASTAAGGGNYKVEIPLYINGREFYRASLADLRSAMKSDPEVM